MKMPRVRWHRTQGGPGNLGFRHESKGARDAVQAKNGRKWKSFSGSGFRVRRLTPQRSGRISVPKMWPIGEFRRSLVSTRQANISEGLNPEGARSVGQR
jgi:hypothetical protein